jgi:DNA-binding CsgD family transcriptional regulator
MRKRGDAWTAAESEALRQLSTAGITKSEAARRLGRHAWTIYSHSRRAGLKWTPPPRPRSENPAGISLSSRPWTTEEDRKLMQLASQGVPIGLAANQMDRAYNTVRKHAGRLGLAFDRDRQARARHRQT